MQFELQNNTSGPTQVNNVIAEIRGRELPDEWILIGAHLDSWDYGTGAQDNGTGSAMVLDVLVPLPARARRRAGVSASLYGVGKSRAYSARTPILSRILTNSPNA